MTISKVDVSDEKKSLNSPSAVCTLYWPGLFRWWHDTSDVVWEDCTPPCSYFQTHPIDLSLHVTLKHICGLWFSCPFSRSLQIFYSLIFQSKSNLVCFGKHFHSEPFSSLDPRQVRLQASKSFTELTLVTYYRTSRVDVNCADKFHTLRRRVVRRVYTIFLRSRSKKCVIHLPLLFGAIIFPCISLLCE